MKVGEGFIGTILETASACVLYLTSAVVGSELLLLG
jgi:hypothetical protein